MHLTGLFGLATTCLLTPLVLPSYAEATSDNDGDTRVWLKEYGFFPLGTHSKTTKETLDLSDVLDMLTGVFSGKVAIGKERSGVQAGMEHLRFCRSETVSTRDSSDPIQMDATATPRLKTVSRWDTADCLTEAVSSTATAAFACKSLLSGET